MKILFTSVIDKKFLQLKLMLCVMCYEFCVKRCEVISLEIKFSFSHRMVTLSLSFLAFLKTMLENVNYIQPNITKILLFYSIQLLLKLEVFEECLIKFRMEISTNNKKRNKHTENYTKWSRKSCCVY